MGIRTRQRTPLSRRLADDGRGVAANVCGFDVDNARCAERTRIVAGMQPTGAHTESSIRDSSSALLRPAPRAAVAAQPPHPSARAGGGFVKKPRLLDLFSGAG